MFDMEMLKAVFDDEPYFGEGMAGAQSPSNRYPWMRAAVKLASEGRAETAIMEIGAWAGASSVAWAWALRSLDLKGKVVCVDTWSPYFDTTVDPGTRYRQMTEAAAADVIFRLFKHNIRTSGYADIVSPVRGPSREVLPQMKGQSFDLIYIDGAHDFDNVYADTENAKALISEGGIICGDDLELMPSQVDTADMEAYVRKGVDIGHAMVDGENRFYHPGVTAAVGKSFGEVASYHGFWAVQKKGDRFVPAVLDPAFQQVPPHLVEVLGKPPAFYFVEEAPGFNIFAMNARYAAFAHRLGVIDVGADIVGDRDIQTLVLAADTLDEIRTKAHKAATKFVGPYRNFNVFTRNGRFFAVAHAVGAFDPDSQLGDGDIANDILAAADEAALHSRIDQLIG